MNNAEHNHYHAEQDRLDEREERISRRTGEIAAEMRVNPQVIQDVLSEVMAGKTNLPNLLVLNRLKYQRTHDLLWNCIANEIEVLARDVAEDEISWGK